MFGPKHGRDLADGFALLIADGAPLRRPVLWRRQKSFRKNETGPRWRPWM